MQYTRLPKNTLLQDNTYNHESIAYRLTGQIARPHAT